MKNNSDEYKNVFLAKIVSFDNYSVLFQINDLEPCTECYRLVKVFPNGCAYDLLLGKRYKVLNVTNGIIHSEDLDKIKPFRLYVYDICSFVDIWPGIKETYGIQEDLNAFLDKYLSNVNELNGLLKNKVIDLNKVKKLTNERKY